jgi:alpha-2-macroglobulin
MAPALLVASGAGDYAFLNLKAAGLRSDRPRRGRPRRAARLDAFVYTERGVYRTGETVHVTALLRDAQGIAAPASR